MESKRGSIGSRVKHWQISLAIIAALSASIALAEDFKTIKGKEYKNVTVSRVEADGIVVRDKTGISKVYFSELPNDLQERFRSKPAQAATAAAQPKPEQMARANAEARRADEEHRELHAATTAPDLGFLFPTAVVITIIVGVIIASVTAVRAKRRRELQTRLFNEAGDFTATIAQNRALPVAPTDIMLKPGESAFIQVHQLYMRHAQSENTAQSTAGSELPKAFISAGQVVGR